MCVFLLLSVDSFLQQVNVSINKTRKEIATADSLTGFL